MFETKDEFCVSNTFCSVCTNNKKAYESQIEYSLRKRCASYKNSQDDL